MGPVTPDNSTALRLLSSVPWFDEETAKGLIGLGLADDPEVEAILKEVRASGLVRRRGELERIEEPARSKWRQELHSDDQDLYRRALRVFTGYAQGDLSEKLESVLGVEGAFLTIRALECVADPAAEAPLDQLVARLEGGPDDFDSFRASAVSRLIHHYEFKRTRLSDFFEGLALWADGRRREAARLFERVLAEDSVDRPAAISAHLLGVSLYQANQLVEAEDVLQDAVGRLRDMRDIQGLVVTLSSLGRTQRELFRNTHDWDYLDSAISSLVEAASLPAAAQRRGRVLQYLAQCYTDAGQHPQAIRTATDATEIASSGEEGVHALTVLASAHRAAGNMEDYIDAIHRADALAEAGNVSGQPLARLLNMGAAAARRSGDLRAAESLARKSLRMGRRLENPRHIAHATHTLAAVLVDRLERDGISERTASEARELLDESRLILATYRDVDGVEKVDATLGRLIAIVRR